MLWQINGVNYMSKNYTLEKAEFKVQVNFPSSERTLLVRFRRHKEVVINMDLQKLSYMVEVWDRGSLYYQVEYELPGDVCDERPCYKDACFVLQEFLKYI